MAGDHKRPVYGRVPQMKHEARVALGDAMLRRASPMIGVATKLAAASLMPAARAYLGGAAAKTEGQSLLGLAVTKMAFELGEMALQSQRGEAGEAQMFMLDQQGNAPGLKLAYAPAIAQAWSMRRKTELQAEAAPPQLLTARESRAAMRTARFNPGSVSMATTTTRAPATAPSRTRPAAGGCGCGTPKPKPSKPAPPSLADPCAGGIPRSTRPPEVCGGCGGCSAHGCQCGGPRPTKTYDNCPPCRISCETKDALRECVKVAVCDFLRCFADTFCPDGEYDPKIFASDKFGELLKGCFGQMVCSIAHCIPEALCPEPEECPPPAVAPDCLPCGFAVENPR
jgi:hypothetical protein